jgi:hypothetical protein
MPPAPSAALLLGAMAVATSGLAAQASDRIYARVQDASGERYEGYVRWDRNEAVWWDLLDASREPDRDVLALVRGEDETESLQRSVEFLGVRISWTEDPDEALSAQVGIRFGHLRSLRPIGDDRAEVVFRSGQVVELYGGSTDLGVDMRGLTVEDPVRGSVELGWRDLELVAFGAAPESSARPSARRLYGTVEDRWGNRFRGYVSWNLDAVLTSDALRGREEGRQRVISFGNVEALERMSAREVGVSLSGGERVVLEGSHRGVQVFDPGLGRVEVPWRELRAVRFEEPEDGVGGHAAFDGGARLEGVVETEDGETLTGRLVWDADEAWSWEMLDGDWRGLEFVIEFGQLASIARVGSARVRATLRDGRVFELEGSNDVNDGNRGLVVEADGRDPVVIPWDRFRRVTFLQPGLDR